MSQKIIYIFILVSIFALFLYSISHTATKKLRYFRYDSRGMKGVSVQKAFESVVKSNGIERANTPQEADLIFLERFSDQNVFEKIKVLPAYLDKCLYTLVSVDQLSSKSALYDLMRRNSTEADLLSIFPRSFVTSNGRDVRELETYVEEGNIIILKKNIQQQKGCLITDSIADIDIGEYTIAQELLQNPYTVSGRKINIRVYVMIQCDRYSTVHIYVYDDGFMYYTPKEYAANTMEKDRNITTGYIDRDVYKDNPLTLQDFKSALGVTAGRQLSKNILKCFKKLFAAISNDIREMEETFPLRKFIIMGADVAVDTDLNVKLMEINKGPDLQSKDARDGELKKNMIQDAFELQGMSNKNQVRKNGWSHIFMTL